MEVYWPAAAAILLALLGIAGVVIKLTKSKKDDEVFEKVSKILTPMLESATTKADDEEPKP